MKKIYKFLKQHKRKLIFCLFLISSFIYLNDGFILEAESGILKVGSSFDALPPTRAIVPQHKIPVMTKGVDGFVCFDGYNYPLYKYYIINLFPNIDLNFYNINWSYLFGYLFEVMKLNCSILFLEFQIAMDMYLIGFLGWLPEGHTLDKLGIGFDFFYKEAHLLFPELSLFFEGEFQTRILFFKEPFWIKNKFDFEIYYYKQFSRFSIYTNMQVYVESRYYFFLERELKELSDIELTFFSSFRFKFFYFFFDFLCYSINFLLIFFFLVFVYVIIFYYFFINFYKYSFNLVYGRYFSLYVFEADDDIITINDYIYEHNLEEEQQNYYNIVKYEDFYFDRYVLECLKIFKWYFLSEKSSNFFCQYNGLSFKILNEFRTKISTYPCPWTYHTFGGEPDEVTEEQTDWSGYLYYPYDMLRIAFPESQSMFNDFKKHLVFILDMENESIIYFKKKNSKNIYKIWKNSKVPKFLKHPRDVYFFYKGDLITWSFLHNEIDSQDFLRYCENIDRVKNIYINRSKNFFKKAIQKLIRIDNSVNFFGCIENVNELNNRSLEVSMVGDIGREYLYEENLVYVAHFYEDLYTQKYLGFWNTADSRYKMSPSIWRFFNFDDYFGLLVMFPLMHFLMRKHQFWEDNEGIDIESDGLAEDKYLFSADDKIGTKIKMYEKVSLFFSYNDIAARQKENLDLNFGSNNYFKNLEKKEQFWYPPYDSFVGFSMLPPEYRYKDIFRLNSFVKNSEMYFFLRYGVPDIEIYNSPFKKKRNPSFLLDNSYFVGFDGFPDGLGVESILNEENPNKNSRQICNKQIELLEEEERDFNSFFIFKEAADLFIFIGISVIIVCTIVF